MKHIGKVGLVVLLLLQVSVCALAQTRSDSLAQQRIKLQIESGDLNLHYPKSVGRLYRSYGYQPLWTRQQPDHKSTWDAMLLIDCVLQFGLAHSDYHPDELRYDLLHDILDTPGKIKPAQQDRFDIMLSDALIAFMNNLHYGKYNPDFPPARVDGGVNIPLDVVSVLKAALSRADFMDLVAAVQPQAKIYAELQARMQILKGQYLDDCYEVPEKTVRQIAINMERIRWYAINDSINYVQVNIPSATVKFHTYDTNYFFKAVVGRITSPTRIASGNIDGLSTVATGPVGAVYYNNDQMVNNLLYVNGQSAKELIYFRVTHGRVELYGTAPNKIYSRANRTLSNGDILIQDGAKLAALLITGEKKPFDLRYLKTHPGKAHQLKYPMPVIVTYLTCRMDHGVLVNYNDVYLKDAGLEKAMYGTTPAHSKKSNR